MNEPKKPEEVMWRWLGAAQVWMIAKSKQWTPEETGCIVNEIRRLIEGMVVSREFVEKWARRIAPARSILRNKAYLLDILAEFGHEVEREKEGGGE